jgi:hypothetical protein
MTKIVREPRLVIRISAPLLAVLEAAGVAEGRTAAGQARAAEPNPVVVSLNNQGAAGE